MGTKATAKERMVSQISSISLLCNLGTDLDFRLHIPPKECKHTLTDANTHTHTHIAIVFAESTHQSSN